MSDWTLLVEQITNRAGRRCEYCRMHQTLQGATFHIEHIVPHSHGGPTDSANLALACPSCNLKKSNNLHAADPGTGALVALFHPRQNAWHEHFKWDGYNLVGMSSIGRATIDAFDLNQPRRILIRQAEEKFGLFPS
jgi:hypothetical protein